MWSFFTAALSPRGTLFWKLVIAAEALFRVWMIYFFYGPMNLIYSDMGRHWVNSERFLKPDFMGASNPYFYQLFLWSARQLTHENRFLMNGTGLVLSWLYLLFWYLFAKEALKSKRWALIYTAILGAIPTHALMFMYFMTETLVLPLTGAALWLTLRAINKRGFFKFIGATALWVCAILTRSVALPAAFVATAWALWRQRRRRALCLVAALAITSSGFYAAGKHAHTQLRRYTPFGDSSLVSIYFASAARDYQATLKIGRRQEMHGFSSPSFYISPFYPYKKWETSRKGLIRFTVDPALEGKDLRQKLEEQLKLNKGKLPRLIFENLIFLSFSHHWPVAGLDNTSGKICVWERLIWFPLILASTIACIIRLRRRISFFPAITLFATIALYGSQITVMEGRYRKFIEPMVLLAVIWAIQSYFGKKTAPSAK